MSQSSSLQHLGTESNAMQIITPEEPAWKRRLRETVLALGLLGLFFGGYLIYQNTLAVDANNRKSTQYQRSTERTNTEALTRNQITLHNPPSNSTADIDDRPSPVPYKPEFISPQESPHSQANRLVDAFERLKGLYHEQKAATSIDTAAPQDEEAAATAPLEFPSAGFPPSPKTLEPTY